MALSMEVRESVVDSMIKLKPAHVIARELEVDISEVIDVMQEFRNKFDDAVKDNPDLLDKKLEHIFKSLQTYEKVQQEAWSMYENTDEENGNVRAKYLKLVMEAESHRDEILQLLGTDKDATARLQMAQTTQTQLVGIIKQVLSGCPKCANLFKHALQANRLMITTDNQKSLLATKVEIVG
jgi:hypothetical protein